MVCCFFGHREVYQDITGKLYSLLENLIVEGVDQFLVGHQGQFDAIVLGQLRKLKMAHPNISYYVVLAYMPKGKEDFPLYDPKETLYPEGLEGIHPRYAISWRNKWLISESDVVVTYIAHDWGGAAQYAKMALRNNRLVINIA